MATNYRRMNTPDLISKKSAKRYAEAEYRLANWEMGAKNVRRLEAFIASFDQTPAKKAKTAPPAGLVAQAEKVSDDLKSQAQEAFRLVFEKAPDGSKRKAGKKAYALVMNGHKVTDVVANVDALIG